MIFILSSCARRVSNLNTSKPLTKGEFQVMLDEPEKYKSRPVDFWGKLYTLPEKGRKASYFVLIPNPKQSSKSIVVEIENSKLSIELAPQDIVHIKGTVEGINKWRNKAGVVVKAPHVNAESILKTDDITVLYPSLKVVEVNQKQSDALYSVTVNKIEIAENETRVYISVTNETDYSYYFTTAQNYLSYGNIKNSASVSNENPYPIPGNATVNVVLLFPAIDKNTTDLNLSLAGGCFFPEAKTLNFTIQL
jgi:hypothetical protein